MPYKDQVSKHKNWVAWYSIPENKARVRECNKRGNAKCRAKILDFFGNKCKHCGFPDSRALQVDHVFADGAEDRKVGGHERYSLWKKIRENPERYQLLCANCNWIKRVENKEQCVYEKRERVA